MKRQYFTVVVKCLCGCDQTEVYHRRSKDPGSACLKLQADLGKPDPKRNSPAGREVEIVTVFRGRLTPLL